VPARFDRDPRDGGGKVHAGGSDGLGERGHDLVRGEGILAGVGDPEAAPEVHLGDEDAGLAGHLGPEAEQRFGGETVRGVVEHLGTDVAVEAEEVEGGMVHDGAGGGERGPRRDGEPELLVLVPGGDELVGAGVDAGGDAEEGRGDDVELRGDPADQVHLVEGVDDDPAHAVGQRGADLAGGLVVAVQGDALGGHAAGQADRQFATAGGVEAEAVVPGELHHRDAGEGLGGVVHVRAREATLRDEVDAGGLRPLADASGQVGEVEDERRGSPLRREVGEPDAAEVRGLRAAWRDERRRPGTGHHMRSGAETPSRSRPFAMTRLVASFSQRRVRWASSTGSSPRGVTRQLSYHLW